MVKDLQDFLAKVQADKALQEKMSGIIKASQPENVFANCNAVAAEMGYTITAEDLQAFADEHKEDLQDAELDKVAGGTLASMAVSGVLLIASTVSTYFSITEAKKEKD